jgi:hypothetical protein
MNKTQSRRLRDAQRAKKRKNLVHALDWEDEMFGYGDDKKTPTDDSDVAVSPSTNAELFRACRELSLGAADIQATLNPGMLRTHWRRRLLSKLMRCKKASIPKDIIPQREHLYFNFTNYKC